MKKLAIIILVSFWASMVFGAEYYVNYDTGADTNDGSISAPFQHSPGDPNATDNAALTPTLGDIVHFASGVVYHGNLNISVSGDASNHIVYRGDWGGTSATMHGDNRSNVTAFNFSSGVSYVDILGFTVTEYGGYADGSEPPQDCDQPITDVPYGFGFSLVQNSYVTIKDIFINEMGIWLNQPPFTAGPIRDSGLGIQMSDCNNIVIDNVEVTKTGVCIAIKADGNSTSDIEIKNCYFHDYIVWGVDVATRDPNQRIANILIHDNIIKNLNDYDNCPDGWQGCGEHPHSDFIFLRNDYDGTDHENIRIYNNQFLIDNGKCSAGTAVIYLSRSPSAYIYNNVFRNTVMSNGSIFASYDRPKAHNQILEIYSNSFYNGRALSLSSTIDPAGSAIIKGNIFYRDEANPIVTFSDTQYTTGSITLEYNIYYRTDVDPNVFYYNSQYDTLANIQANGYEANGIEEDPLYISPENLQLNDGSPGIDMMPNADAPTSLFTTDILGVTRPQGTAWEVGAYEKVVAAPVPSKQLFTYDGSLVKYNNILIGEPR